MEEPNLLKSPPRAHPWGWAFCGSLLTHAGVALVLGLYIVAPQPTWEQTPAIKVDLISMPIAPKVQKKTTPLPTTKEPLIQPVAAPQNQKAIPDLSKKVQSKQKPEISLDKIVEAVPQIVETRPIEPEIPVIAEHEPSENQQGLNAIKPTSSAVPKEEFNTPEMTRKLSEDVILQRYSTLIRERIDKVKRYPLMARKAGKQGRVAVEFSVNRQGELMESNVVNSCGTKALDKAALKALHRASPFARLPDTLNSPHRFKLQINFFLDG